jgi:hypothetical protein
LQNGFDFSCLKKRKKDEFEWIAKVEFQSRFTKNADSFPCIAAENSQSDGSEKLADEVVDHIVNRCVIEIISGFVDLFLRWERLRNDGGGILLAYETETGRTSMARGWGRSAQGENENFGDGVGDNILTLSSVP